MIFRGIYEMGLKLILRQTPIFMYDKADDWSKYDVKTIGELLPMSFGPNDLKRKEDEATTK
jgi:hypothetical protein